MTKRTLLVLAMLVAPLALGAQCKKEETTAASATPPPPPPPEASDAGAAEPTSEVTSYPGEIPQGGTVRLLRSFQVYSAADGSSRLLTGLSAGTLVDLKASYSNWMKIMWPSGVGQLSPGWIQLPNINDSRVQLAQRDAGTTIVDAGVDAPVIVDAAVADASRGDGGRPTIRIPRPR